MGTKLPDRPPPHPEGHSATTHHRSRCIACSFSRSFGGNIVGRTCVCLPWGTSSQPENHCPSLVMTCRDQQHYYSEVQRGRCEITQSTGVNSLSTERLPPKVKLKHTRQITYIASLKKPKFLHSKSRMESIKAPDQVIFLLNRKKSQTEQESQRTVVFFIKARLNCHPHTHLKR